MFESDYIGYGSESVMNVSSTVAPNDNESSVWPVIAAIFAFLALFVSLWEITHHAIHYNKPYLQKYIVRILWMVPIYAMNSWMAMSFPSIAIYVDTLRECYEAFVIYSFMKYLTNFLFYEMDVEYMIECKPQVKQLFPLCFLPPCVGGRRFLNRCKQGILQYTVIRPVTTILALITQSVGVYGEGHYTLNYAYPYLLVVNNLSQMVAMYCLVIFYSAYRYELTPMRPLAKFLCIKAVVFFSFFQGMLISILIEFGFITQAFIPSAKDWKSTDIARNLQDFLICFEMLLAAIAHLFAFSHKPFIDLAAVNDPCCYSFMRIIDISDERTDINDHFRQIGHRIRDAWNRPQRSRHSSIYEENSPLIPLQPRNSNQKQYGNDSEHGYASIDT